MVQTTYLKRIHPLKAAGVTALTRASPGNIVIPAGHTGRLRRIITTVWPAMITVVNAGGFVEIENDAVKGTQISYNTCGGTVVTLGGHQIKNHVIDCDIPIVGPSTYTVWYTPYNIQNQTCSVTLEWVTDSRPDVTKPNYIKGQMPLKATAAPLGDLTALAAVIHGTMDIPSGKGGRLYRVEFVSRGTTATLVCGGGSNTLESSVDDWKPFEFVNPGETVTGAGGSSPQEPVAWIVNKPISGNATISHTFTPYDAQAQTMGFTLFWRSNVDPQ